MTTTSQTERDDRREQYCHWCDEETAHYFEAETGQTGRWECENESDHEYPWERRGGR